MSGSQPNYRPQRDHAKQGRVSVDSFFEVPQVTRPSQIHPMNRPLPPPSFQAPKSTSTDQQVPKRLQTEIGNRGKFTERTYQIQRQNLNNLFELYSKMPVTSPIRAQSLRDTQNRLDSLDRRYTRDRINLAAQEHGLNDMVGQSKSIQQRQRPEVREQPDSNPREHAAMYRHQNNETNSTLPRNAADVRSYASGSLLRNILVEATSSRREKSSRHRIPHDSVTDRSRYGTFQGSSSSRTTYSSCNTPKAVADARNAFPLPTADQRADQRIPPDLQKIRATDDPRSRLPSAEARGVKAQFVPEPALHNLPFDNTMKSYCDMAKQVGRGPKYNTFSKPRTQEANETDLHEVLHAQAATFGKPASTDHLPLEFRQINSSNPNKDSPAKSPRRQRGHTKAALPLQLATGCADPVDHPFSPPPPNFPVNNSKVDTNHASTLNNKFAGDEEILPSTPNQVTSNTFPNSTKTHEEKPNLKVDIKVCNSFWNDVKIKQAGCQDAVVVENIMDLPISCQLGTIKVAIDKANPEVHWNGKDGHNDSVPHEVNEQISVTADAGETAKINIADIDIPSSAETNVELIAESASNSSDSYSPSNLKGKNKLEDDLDDISLESEGSPSPDIDDQLDGTAWEKIDGDGIAEDDEFYHQLANPQKVGWTEAVRRGAWSWIR